MQFAGHAMPCHSSIAPDNCSLPPLSNVTRSKEGTGVVQEAKYKVGHPILGVASLGLALETRAPPLARRTHANALLSLLLFVIGGPRRAAECRPWEPSGFSTSGLNHATLSQGGWHLLFWQFSDIQQTSACHSTLGVRGPSLPAGAPLAAALGLS
ncbi:hypothetical protein LY76DRAFT_595211 [Colletotrichum caudatum]|nr:hypothetical protein LY76DRAFT_595211 [Colletotrichum caudatum]